MFNTNPAIYNRVQTQETLTPLSTRHRTKTKTTKTQHSPVKVFWVIEERKNIR